MNGGKTLFFSFLSNYHNEKKVYINIYIYIILLIEYTKFNYLKKRKESNMTLFIKKKKRIIALS